MPERDRDEYIQALIEENKKQDKRINELEKELKAILKSHKDAILTVDRENEQVIKEDIKLSKMDKKEFFKVLKNHKESITKLDKLMAEVIEEIKKLAQEDAKIWNAIGTRDLMNV